MQIDRNSKPLFYVREETAEEAKETLFEKLSQIEQLLSKDPQLISDDPHLLLGGNPRQQLRNLAERLYATRKVEYTDLILSFFGRGHLHRVDEVYFRIMGREAENERLIRQARNCGWTGNEVIEAKVYLSTFAQDIIFLAKKKHIPFSVLVYNETRDEQPSDLNVFRTLQVLKTVKMERKSFDAIQAIAFEAILENNYIRMRKACILTRFTITNEHNESILFAAVKNGSIMVAEAIIREYPQYWKKGSFFEKIGESQRILHYAVKHGLFSIVDKMITLGVELQDDCFLTTDLEKVNDQGETVFQLEVMRASPKIIKFLIRAGANTNARFADNDHVLHRLIASENITNLACIVNDTDLDARDKRGVTPLIAVAKKAWKNSDLCSEAATLLINAGADLDLVNDEGHTAYQIAQTKGNIKAALVIAQSVEKQKLV